MNNAEDIKSVLNNIEAFKDKNTLIGLYVDYEFPRFIK